MREGGAVPVSLVFWAAGKIRPPRGLNFACHAFSARCPHPKKPDFPNERGLIDTAGQVQRLDLLNQNRRPIPEQSPTPNACTVCHFLSAVARVGCAGLDLNSEESDRSDRDPDGRLAKETVGGVACRRWETSRSNRPTLVGVWK
jgi:hypothetical protein